MKHAVEAVLWDIDGTLVDSEPTHERAVEDVLRTIGTSLSSEARAQILGTSIFDTHAALASIYADLPDLAAFIAAKNAAYLAQCSEIRLRLGVREALAFVETEGLRCAFVSNSERLTVEANLRSAGFDPSNLVTVARDDVRHGKPNPEPYLLAAGRLAVAPSACLVIEDSPLGAAAGLAAGMQVIGWPGAPEAAVGFPVGAVLSDPLDLVGTLALMRTWFARNDSNALGHR